MRHTLAAVSLCALCAAPPARADEPVRFQVSHDKHGNVVYAIRDPVKLFVERQAPRVQYVISPATVPWSETGLDKDLLARVDDATKQPPF